MRCVERNVILDGFDDRPLHVVSAIEFFQAFEYNRVVRYHKVAAFGNGLVNDGFRGVERYQNARDFSSGIAHDQACVVVGFLIGEGGKLLQMSSKVTDLGHGVEPYYSENYETLSSLR